MFGAASLAHPDFPEDHWTLADAAIADEEGWTIYEAKGILEIERNDTNDDQSTPWFPYNEELIEHVATLARAGSRLHFRALKIHVHYRPSLRGGVIPTGGQTPTPHDVTQKSVWVPLTIYDQARLAEDFHTLDGLVLNWASIIGKLAEEARSNGHGLGWVNKHPVNVVFAHHAHRLTGDGSRYRKSLAECLSRALIPDSPNWRRPTSDPRTDRRPPP